MRIRTHGAVEAIRLARAAVLGVSLVVLVPSEAPAQMAGVIKNLFDSVTINTDHAEPGKPTAHKIDHTSHFFLGGENLRTCRAPAECRHCVATGVLSPRVVLGRLHVQHESAW